jgi:Uma2 family endonuclease
MAMTVELAKRLFTVKEYHYMLETGLLTEGEPVELIRGEIIHKADCTLNQSTKYQSSNKELLMVVGRRHAACVKRLNALFHRLFAGQAIISIQDPVEIDEYSEPEPDVCLLRLQSDFYESGHPKAADVLLLIEVADTTLETDRTIKLPLYAEDRIVEVWIVDLKGEQIEVYRQPQGAGYQFQQIFQPGQTLSLQSFPSVAIAVSSVLGQDRIVS